MQSVEIFAGCGGLALGIAEAGFTHSLIVERDPVTSATLQTNKRRGVRHLADWPLHECDVRLVDYSGLADKVELVSGGPPCQPFSIGGKHMGPDDERNMWCEAIRAVRELRPKAFLFENVRGLLRPAFGHYLRFLKLQLSWPEFTQTSRRTWAGQLRLLERHARSRANPSYSVLISGINTADYGAPQKRHRAIVMGVRADVAAEVSFPHPTHSRERLVWTQRISSEYWDRHGIVRRARPAPTESDRRVLEEIEHAGEPSGFPWITVRDAIGDLPQPSLRKEPLPGHRLHPGARIYPRHTGSVWDEPAKAIKAGNHGVPGGENILVSRSGSVRYFTLREMARLQGFPDDFIVGDGWKDPIKQLGNAVPVQVGRAFGLEIRRLILGEQSPERSHSPSNTTALVGVV